jgi:hypothetical protein
MGYSGPFGAFPNPPRAAASLLDPPKIINHQSSIIDHRSSIIDHRSSIIDHRSSIINPIFTP